MKPTAIFDIDGTLASNEWRVPLAKAKRWREFHEGIPYDQPIIEICGYAEEHADDGHTIAYVTNRMEYAREYTEHWLAKFDLPDGNVLMRAENDFRRGSIIKAEQLDVLRGWGLDPKIVYEDHPKIIPVWKDLGLVVVACTDPCLPPKGLTTVEAIRWVTSRMS